MLQKAELSAQADSENNLGGSSETLYFIGLDVHKKTISFCVKDAASRVYQEGKVAATRRDQWNARSPERDLRPRFSLDRRLTWTSPTRKLLMRIGTEDSLPHLFPLASASRFDRMNSF